MCVWTRTYIQSHTHLLTPTSRTWHTIVMYSWSWTVYTRSLCGCGVYWYTQRLVYMWLMMEQTSGYQFCEWRRARCWDIVVRYTDYTMLLFAPIGHYFCPFTQKPVEERLGASRFSPFSCNMDPCLPNVLYPAGQSQILGSEVPSLYTYIPAL